MQQPDHSCFLQIQTLYSTFSDKEKKVADYILNHSSKMIHETINQVANELGLAEATIFRFCKRIGYKGFRALKISLASIGIKPIEADDTLNEQEETSVANRILKANIRALDSTMQALDSQMLNQAIDAISHARRVEFYGNGASGLVAVDAHYQFLKTGIATAAYQDFHFQTSSLSQLKKTDVVILISQSGGDPHILHLLKLAKAQGVTTIGITALAQSPLSKGVDMALFTVTTETPYHSAILSSRIAQLSIIDILYEHVSLLLLKN
ncbi:MurR/RpiR family transcriptional regulator [Halalkalibacter alkalisediminis]|uniref:MurR/RpiR family transcriptional regulator n=1 Tax=Halalkalibacter alkalisediminis TaxID=935616 RepID=A0ABV6NA13_9BACI|nr:MurR/RpiR family transcriptional regulator [Halalkalibacter alkalisediminis]